MGITTKRSTVLKKGAAPTTFNKPTRSVTPAKTQPSLRSAFIQRERKRARKNNCNTNLSRISVSQSLLSFEDFSGKL